MTRRVLRSIILVNNDNFQAIRVSRAVGGPRVFGPPEGSPILFLLSPEVSGTSVMMSIYIYICQQHGGREVGTESFGYISVKFIRLLLLLSAKSLFDQKSSSKYFLVNNDDFQAIRVSRAVGGPRVF